MQIEPILSRVLGWATLVALLPIANPPAAAQPPASQPERPKNLKVFPTDIERDVLIGHMRDFAFALGVACTHCHGTEEQTGFSLRGVDFSLDIKPTKAKARDMMRMTETINAKLLSEIPASALGLDVTCFTCHSGLALPETIEARVLRTIESDGVDAAIADYRATRERYLGSAAYNFKEQPLVEVASELHEQERYQAAAGVSRLNLAFHPDSGQSTFRLAEAYFALGDRDRARPLYEAMLREHPDNRMVRARLDALGEPDD